MECCFRITPLLFQDDFGCEGFASGGQSNDVDTCRKGVQTDFGMAGAHFTLQAEHDVGRMDSYFAAVFGIADSQDFAIECD